MANGNPNTLQAFRQQVDATLQQRIAAHKAAVAARGLMAMPQATRPLILLADGNSWFDYPLSGDSLVPSDIIVQLQNGMAPAPTILDLAHYGDATTELLGVAKRTHLQAALKDPANGTFDAILFSGGGNDLVGDQFRLWLCDAAAAGNDPTAALNQGALSDILGVVQTAYEDLIVLRNDVALGTPIFVHAYDFAQPTGNGVCLLGPWLAPSLESRGWMQSTSAADVAVGAGIVKLILTEFYNLLRAFSLDPNNNVVLVETQGVLDPGTEWANELHPNPPGFGKIAARFVAALATRFPGRANAQAPQVAALPAQHEAPNG